MENVSKTTDEQLNLLLEEAEDELQQLEQDSLGCVCRKSDFVFVVRRAFTSASRKLRVPRPLLADLWKNNETDELSLASILRARRDGKNIKPYKNGHVIMPTELVLIFA